MTINDFQRLLIFMTLRFPREHVLSILFLSWARIKMNIETVWFIISDAERPLEVYLSDNGIVWLIIQRSLMDCGDLKARQASRFRMFKAQTKRRRALQSARQKRIIVIIFSLFYFFPRVGFAYKLEGVVYRLCEKYRVMIKMVI